MRSRRLPVARLIGLAVDGQGAGWLLHRTARPTRLDCRDPSCHPGRMTNDDILFLCITAGTVAFLAISFVLSRRRGDNQMFVRSQYVVTLTLSIAVLNAIFERLFG